MNCLSKILTADLRMRWLIASLHNQIIPHHWKIDPRAHLDNPQDANISEPVSNVLEPPYVPDWSKSKPWQFSGCPPTCWALPRPGVHCEVWRGGQEAKGHSANYPQGTKKMFLNTNWMENEKRNFPVPWTSLAPLPHKVHGRPHGRRCKVSVSHVMSSSKWKTQRQFTWWFETCPLFFLLYKPEWNQAKIYNLC